MQLFSIKIFMITIAATVSLVKSECRNEEFANFDVECSNINGYYVVEIICHSDELTTFGDSKLDLNFVGSISFQHCNLSTTSNVQDIIRTMQIQSYDSITLMEQRSVLKRQNLIGLITPNFHLIINEFDELPFDLLYDVLNIETLQIFRTRLTCIPENFFSDWAENVTNLYMNSNKLRKIAKNDFTRISKLRTIDLSNNAIEEIERGAFNTLSELETIMLQSNRLRILPNSLFHRTIGLTTIDLSENSFDDLPQDLLKNTKELLYFTLSHNNGSLATLHQRFFENLAFLQNVQFDDGQLQNIPSNVFSGCFALCEVDFSRNRLTNLPSGLFQDTISLLSIQISNNSLESLPAGIFNGINQLMYLNIGSNRLISLTSDVLDGLQSLEDFNASNNNLTQLDDQFFEYLKSATYINLSSNQLTFESRDKSKLQHRNATPLMYKRNRIIDNNSKNLEIDYDPILESRIIDLRHNKIRQLDVELISTMIYSNSIDLRYNEISKINLSDFSSDMLARNVTYNGITTKRYLKIHLENNPIQCDCNLADFVHYLKLENQLHNIFVGDKLKCTSPSELEKHKLREIQLEDLNCLLKTDDENDACNKICICREYPKKQTLSVDCSYKNLTSIPSIIGNMQNYSIELNMTGNMLKYAPSLRDSHLENITSLDLSNNNISKLTIDLFSPKLQHLKLHGNEISRLKSNVIDYLASNNTLRSITLHDNKWICDCKTRQFLNFVQKKFTNYGFHEIKCYGTNRKLYKMTVSELCEGMILIVVITSLSFAVLGIVIASFVALYYKYQNEIKVWLYSKQLCLWFVTEDELDKDKEYDAFISFSHKDEDFVEKEIVAKLEEGSKPYKLCLHYRDWLAGEWIPVQISRSVAKSRRTIVVLTANFLESVWGLLEFRAAHTQALKEGRTRLIVILCGDINNMDDLDEEMKDYLRLNTYIKWGDPSFWDKLRYALPHGKEFSKSKSLTNDIDADTVQIPNDISITKLRIVPNNSPNLADPSVVGERLIVESNL